MDGNKAFWEEFIQMYRSFPCLWDVKSKNYADRNLRNAALEELTKKCKEVHPLATRDYVTKKIHNFRCGFRRELKKIKASTTTGCSVDDRYVPSLWYFDIMSFITETEDHRQGTESIESQSEIDETVETDNVSIKKSKLATSMDHSFLK